MRTTLVGTAAQLVAAAGDANQTAYELVDGKVTRFVLRGNFVSGGPNVLFQLTEPIAEATYTGLFSITTTLHKPVAAIV
jgi:hypothetical protein